MNTQAIEKVYKSYTIDVRKILFFGGKKQLENIISSIAYILNLKNEDLNYDTMKALTNIYVDTCIRKTARDEDVDIISDMPKKHKTYVKSVEEAAKLMAYLVLESSDSSYCLPNNNQSDYDDLRQMYLDSFVFMKQNEGKENKYLKDSEYGLVENKPIYTHGQTGTDLYFSYLMGKNDEELIYEYETSLEVNGINGFVDKYIIKKDGSDLVYASIYINRYGNTNSKTAPKGFKLKKENIEGALEKSRENVRKDLKKKTIIEIVTGLLVLIVIVVLLIKNH